jgi:phosphatidylglycerophosphate synthase
MSEDNKKDRKDSDPTMKVLRKLSIWIGNILAKTKITPNQITAFNFIIFTPLILYFISRGTYYGGLITLAFIAVTVVLDLCDGTVARIKNLSSPYGSWLDGSLDVVFQNSLLVAASVGVYYQTGEAVWFIIGLIMLFGQNLANVMGGLYDREFSFEAYSGSKVFFDKFSGLKKISFPDSFFKNIIVPVKLIYIVFFTCRYWLILGLIFGRLDLFLLIFSITINIRWISMWILYLKYISGWDSQLYTIKFLRQIKNEKNIK